ncbi:ATPase RavA [Pycnococcus provasolii]
MMTAHSTHRSVVSVRLHHSHRRITPGPSRLGPHPVARASSSDGDVSDATRAMLEDQETRIEEEIKRVRNDAAARVRDVTSADLSANPAYAPATDIGGETSAMRTRLAASITQLQRGLVERDTETRLMLLASLAREHVLFLGPPGTAKSELGRRLCRVVGGNYFERLLTRFSVPEELFGPLSMKGLENDKYVRSTGGFLPEANVAFVDEVFKANSAILNALLTILNERLFDNGGGRIAVPLVSLVGASNELPESEELDALYDRFLVRRNVAPVTRDGLVALLSQESTLLDDPASDEPMLTVEETAEVRARALSAVKLPESVLSNLVELREYLAERCEPPVYVSDRRMLKAVNLLKVSAYTCGRAEVSSFDCLLLEHVLWTVPEDAEKVRDWLLRNLTMDEGLDQVQYLLAGCFARACRIGADYVDGGGGGSTIDASTVKADAKALVELLSTKYNATATALDDGFPGITGHLWLGEDTAEGAISALTPLLERNKKKIKTLLDEAAVLEAAAEGATEPHILAELLPQQWANFIRSGPMDEVKPLGTVASP